MLFAGAPALPGRVARRLAIAGLLLPGAVVLAAIAVLVAAHIAGSLPTSP